MDKTHKKNPQCHRIYSLMEQTPHEIKKQNIHRKLLLWREIKQKRVVEKVVEKVVSVKVCDFKQDSEVEFHREGYVSKDLKYKGIKNPGIQGRAFQAD